MKPSSQGASFRILSGCVTFDLLQSSYNQMEKINHVKTAAFGFWALQTEAQAPDLKLLI